MITGWLMNRSAEELSKGGTAKFKRPILIYDGVPYRHADVVSEPRIVLVGEWSDPLPIGQNVTLYLRRNIAGLGILERAIRVERYTISQRKSGRPLYEFFGKEQSVGMRD